jgi:histidyl-tRNA synthetase (EC 6.1.1.21)
MERRRYIETCMRRTARGWGYREVCTPVFEDLELFTLRSGEGIIQEMYTFEDKGGRKQALRPEVTAPVLRLFVNEGGTYPNRYGGTISVTVSAMSGPKRQIPRILAILVWN